MAGYQDSIVRILIFLVIIYHGCVEAQIDVVATVPHVSLERGSEGVLLCTVKGDPSLVAWRKGRSDDGAETLVTRDASGEKGGAGFGDGSKDISDNNSLLIRDVEVMDEGRYICEVSLGEGSIFRNYTQVNIYAPPLEPFPRVEDCRDDDGSPNSCTAYTDGESRNLTCYALQYYPNLTLSLTQHSEPIQPVAVQEEENNDGTKNKLLTIRAVVSEDPYTCISSGIPGQQADRQLEITVKMGSPTTPPQQSDGGVDIVMIALLTLLGLVCLAIAVCMLVWRYRKKKRKYKGVPKQGDGETGDETSSAENEELDLEVIPNQGEVPLGSGRDPITDEELKTMADRLAGRHCWRLSEQLGVKTSLLQVKAIDVIIRENEKTVFDVHLLLKEWVESQTGADDDKRRRLLQTAQKIGRGDLKDYKCIDDDELRQLIKTLDSDSLKSNVCEILGVKYDYEDDEGDFFQKLCAWRTGKPETSGAVAVSTSERYRRFQDAIRSINIIKSSSFPFKRHVSENRELYELSSLLLLHDLRPFTEALGLGEGQLTRYCRPFSEKNVEAGTMCLMKELLDKQDGKWEKMCKVLRNMGYYQAAQMGLSGNYVVE